MVKAANGGFHVRRDRALGQEGTGKVAGDARR